MIKKAFRFIAENLIPGRVWDFIVNVSDDGEPITIEKGELLVLAAENGANNLRIRRNLKAHAIKRNCAILFNKERKGYSYSIVTGRDNNVIITKSERVYKTPNQAVAAAWEESKWWYR